jgi:hypothetical protein
VGGKFLVRLGEVEIIGELGTGLLLAFPHGGLHLPAFPHFLAQAPCQIRVLGKSLDQDGAGTIESSLDVCDLVLAVGFDESHCFRIGDQARIG